MSEPLNNKPETPRQLPKLCKECRCVLWTRSATCSCSCHRMPEETYKQPETPRPEMPVLKKLQWDLHDFLESLVEHGDQAISEPAKWLLQSVDAIKQKLRPEMGKREHLWEVVRGKEADDWGITAAGNTGSSIAQMMFQEDAEEVVALHNAAASGTESTPGLIEQLRAMSRTELEETALTLHSLKEMWAKSAKSNEVVRLMEENLLLKSQPSSLIPVAWRYRNIADDGWLYQDTKPTHKIASPLYSSCLTQSEDVEEFINNFYKNWLHTDGATAIRQTWKQFGRAQSQKVGGE